LSAGWLKSSHIELQVLYLQERLQRQPVPGRRIGIAPLVFTNRLVQRDISKGFDSKDVPTDTVMRNVEAHVLTKNLDELYMPVHLSTQHWIVLAVDFKSGTMRFGISFSECVKQCSHITSRRLASRDSNFFITQKYTSKTQSLVPKACLTPSHR
jgi:hypothetical protein